MARPWISNRSTITIASCAIAVAFLAGVFTNNPAGAEDGPKETILGPATAVDLQGKDSMAIRLHVAEERLAWGDQPQQRIYSTGYVHIGKVLAALMQGASYQEDQAQLQEELLAAQKQIVAGLESVQERMDGLPQDDPEYPEIAKEAQTLFQQREQFLQRANAAKAMLGAEHVERAYRELVDAVNVVADRMHIDIVERFIPTDDSFETPPGPQAFNAAMLQIRLRSVLRYPDGSDITDEVLEELGVE